MTHDFTKFLDMKMLVTKKGSNKTHSFSLFSQTQSSTKMLNI